MYDISVSKYIACCHFSLFFFKREIVPCIISNMLQISFLHTG